MNSVEIRSQLVDALRLDLIGPDSVRNLGTPDEVLTQAPSRWYLTGFLVPTDAGENQKADVDVTDELNAMAEAGGTDDATAPEPPTARRNYMPSSIGMSVLVAAGTQKAQATVRWGNYKQVVSGSPATDNGQLTTVWRRTACEEQVTVELPDQTKRRKVYDVPGSAGLRLAVTVRPVEDDGGQSGLPTGTRSVSIFLVNNRKPAPDETRDEAFAFQVQLELTFPKPLVPRPNVRSMGSSEWDERVADLQYRDVYEYAVGHNVATEAILGDGHCHQVRTCWVPQAEVERVAPAEITGVVPSMDALTQLGSADEARSGLGGFVAQYRQWIAAQRAKLSQAPPRRKETGEELLRLAEIAAERIEQGIALLGDPQCLLAFKLANRVMATAARRRQIVTGQSSVVTRQLSVAGKTSVVSCLLSVGKTTGPGQLTTDHGRLRLGVRSSLPSS